MEALHDLGVCQGTRRPAGLPTPRPSTNNSEGVWLSMFLRTNTARIHARLKECVAAPDLRNVVTEVYHEGCIVVMPGQVR